MAPLERLEAFTYLHVDLSPLYRAIMRGFLVAKERFTLHLRPAEVSRALEELSRDWESIPEPVLQAMGDGDQLERALHSLVQWGNLERHPDTAEVSTVEDFYRPRFLYQLSARGEAVERALDTYFEHLRQPGELQTAALSDIRAELENLLRLADDASLDAGKVHRSLRALFGRFDELTRRAQVFIGSLQRTIDLQDIDLEDFLAYKEILIDYLERFIGELLLATNDIAGLLTRLEAAQARRLLDVAVERELADAVEVTESLRRTTRSHWRGRWRGLATWFVDPSGTSQAEVLRSRARSAIPALLSAVETLHDRRTTRSDRSTDLRTLARWFAECDTEHDAHRLWRAAFGLTPSRHLRVDADTLDRWDQVDVPAHASWLEAPPLRIAPKLRRVGTHKRRARVKVIDRAEAKARLAEWIAAEAEQIASARRRLAQGRRLRLSDFTPDPDNPLDAAAFQLFLDLLGEALTHRVQGEVVEATSSDGALHIVLEPTDDQRSATLVTAHGIFTGRDHWVTIHETGSGVAP